ncbi:putative signal transducing protein [Halomonas sp. THAF12]|uniref:putative signal transducing protein n=1 Tax=Halomonas sp. B23F22_10 TaxID=3459515 RepID=UPI00373E51DF
MRLIRQYEDVMQAQDAASRLRREGIPTHISSRHSHVASGVVTGALKVGLWILLDSQYHDACAFLEDADHRVTTGLPEEELVRLESAASETSFVSFNRLLWYGGPVILAVIVGLVYLKEKGVL